MSIFALLRRLERISRPAPSLAHDYDLPVQDVDDEVWAPTVPSRESLLDAWFYAKTPEVEKQAKDELDRYYPNFAGAAASLAVKGKPSYGYDRTAREDKQRDLLRSPAGPHTTSQPSPVTTRTSSGDSSAAAGTLPPTAAAEPLTWLGWAVPAILDVLAEHYIERPTGICRCGDGLIGDLLSDYHEHVAPLIAERIGCDPARAVAALQNFQPK